MDRHEIAHILEEIATLLELKGDNPFKIQAYRSGAHTLESIGEEFDQLVKQEQLATLPGIGKALAEKITTLHTTGHLDLYEELKKSLPEGLLEILAIPGLGAKKVKILYEKLNITTVKGLKKACTEGTVEQLEGFGKKTEENILSGIRHLEEYSQRHLWWHAMIVAQPILEGLRALKEVDQAEIAGSLRRKLETVGDIDFVVASSHPEPIMEWFTTHEGVAKITAKGPTKSSVRLKEGMQVDLRVVPPEQYAFALTYFIGSKEHNIQLRHRARLQGLSLSEWGLEPIDEKKKSPLPPGKGVTEKDLYKTLGLAYIPPEIRENMGEIEAAEKGTLPKLVSEKDIHGVFHNHTTESDGHNTLEEMAAAAEAMGWEYLGIADHSKSSFQANGLEEERLLAQIEAIRKLNSSKKFKVHLFAGVECDVMKDGTLDYEDAILKQLDYVVISIHRSFKLDENTMTKRLIRAIENPYATMVGHLTGRILLRREPYPVNIPKVIDATIANGKIMELNASPSRLDMDWRQWRAAKEKGLLCSINPDAHHVDHLQFYKAGINSARKGWLEKKDIFNTRPLNQVKEFFTHRR